MTEFHEDPMDTVAAPARVLIGAWLGLFLVYLLYFKIWSWLLGG
jgi:hypothetical protein